MSISRESVILLLFFYVYTLVQSLNLTCIQEPDVNLCNHSTIPLKGLEERVCKCDEECNFYGDCCIDFAKLDPSRKTLQTDCENVGEKQIYVFRGCAAGWEKTQVQERCHSKTGKHFSDGYLNNLYVFSYASKRLYANIFCAICNQDVHSLLQFDLHIVCKKPVYLNEPTTDNETSVINFSENAFYDIEKGVWQVNTDNKTYNCEMKQSDLNTFVVNNTNLRSCVERNLTDCPATWKNETVRKLCVSYIGAPIYRVRESYKNYHCAVCDEPNEDLLRCFTWLISKKRTMIKPKFSFKQLLDVKISSGNLVGQQESTNCQLSKGEVFDPITQKCADYSCPRSFEKNKRGDCVLKKQAETSGNASLITTACRAVKREPHEFVTINDSMIYINKTQKYFAGGEFEFNDDGSVKICLSGLTSALTLNESSFQALLSFGCLTASITCLVLHLIFYSMAPPMRTESGKLQISMATALLLAHISFALATTTTNPNENNLYCLVSGISMHYFFLASFFWMNVLSFDVWYTFAASFRKQRRKQWKLYSAYAWGVPALIVGMALINEYKLPENDFKPLYGYQICWINQRKALLVFFVLELAFVMLSNLVFFLLTLKELRSTKATVERASIKDNKICFKLYVKLALIMGLTWTFGFSASIDELKFLLYPFIVLNGLQGVFIFIGFGCRPMVIRRVRGSIVSFWDSRFSSSQQTSTMQDFTSEGKGRGSKSN